MGKGVFCHKIYLKSVWAPSVLIQLVWNIYFYSSLQFTKLFEHLLSHWIGWSPISDFPTDLPCEKQKLLNLSQIHFFFSQNEEISAILNDWAFFQID